MTVTMNDLLAAGEAVHETRMHYDKALTKYNLLIELMSTQLNTDRAAVVRQINLRRNGK